MNENRTDNKLFAFALLGFIAIVFIAVCGIGAIFQERPADEEPETVQVIAEPTELDLVTLEEKKLNIRLLKLEVEYYELLVDSYRQYKEAEPLH